MDPLNQALALAHISQATIDALNGERILGLSGTMPHASALALAQSQQACEKALKALIYWVVGRSAYARPTHRVWTDDLQNTSLYRDRVVWNESFSEADLRALRQRVEVLIDKSNLRRVGELEGYAPNWTRRNTEYPWIEEGGVQVPALYFDSVMVAAMNKVARNVVKAIAFESASLKKEWQKAIEVYRIAESD